MAQGTKVSAVPWMNRIGHFVFDTGSSVDASLMEKPANARVQTSISPSSGPAGSHFTCARRTLRMIASGEENGTISVNGAAVAIKGLAALAYKSEVAESDLAAALKAIIDAKAKQADLDTLTGDGEGSISKMIDAAINKFATDVTDDNVVNSYKELIDWVAKHGPEATKMAGGISENKTAIADLKTLVGTLPEGATSTTVVAYITEAINALSIGDYAKTTEVTAAINTALESYYTKTQVDETFVKKTDIVMATDEEVDAMLTEVFGAQATV